MKRRGRYLAPKQKKPVPLIGTAYRNIWAEVRVAKDFDKNSSTGGIQEAIASLGGLSGMILISDDIDDCASITLPAFGGTGWRGVYLFAPKPATKITFTPTTGHWFSAVGATNPNQRIAFKNLNIYGPGATSGDCINLDGSTGLIELSMENVLIQNFGGGVGLYGKEIYNGGGRDVEINYCNIGFKFEAQANANYWTNLKVQWNKTYGGILDGVIGFGWFGGLVQSNEEHGLYITGSHNLLFDQVYWENNNSSETASRYALWLNATDGASNSRLTFDTCRWVDPAVLQSQIWMGGVAGYINNGVYFFNCHHAGNDGNQVVIDTPYNADVRFWGGFDPARISNVSNCNVYTHRYDGGAGILDYPSFLGNKRWTHGTVAPTAGTWARGDICWRTNPIAGGTPGWVCVHSGTLGAATDSTGDTDGSTAVITGMTDTSDFALGDWVDVSAGFPTTGPYKIVAKTSTTVTLDTASNSAQSDITVDTSDPTWKAMANLAA